MPTLEESLDLALKRRDDPLRQAMDIALDPTMDEARVREAVKTDPDTAARQWRLGQDTGVPLGVVRDHERETREKSLYDALDVALLRRKAPGVAAHLRNPDTASAIADDTGPLADIEAWTSAQRSARELDSPLTAPRLAGLAAVPGVGLLGAGLALSGARSLQELADTILMRPTRRAGLSWIEAEGGMEQAGGEEDMAAARRLQARAAAGEAATPSLTRQVAMAGGRPDPGAGRALTPADVAAAVTPELREAYAGALAARGKEVEADAARRASAGELKARLAHELREAYAPQWFAGGGSEFAGEAVEAIFASVLPLMGASVIPGVGPVVGLGFMGRQVYGNKYADARREGRTPEQASMDAAFYSLAEIVPEVVPLGFALRAGREGIQAIVKKTFETSLAEAGQESLTEALQLAYDTGVVGENVTMKEALQRIAKAGALGFVVGTPMGVIGGVARNNRMANERFHAEQARLQELLRVTAGSKTLARDAGLFHAVTTGDLGQVKLYVDAAKAQEFFQSNPQAAQAFTSAVPEVSEQMEDALERGGDLILPANKVAAVMARQEGFEPLQVEMRLSPLSLTDSEAQDATLEALAQEVSPSRDLDKLVADPRIQDVMVTRSAVVEDTGGLAEFQQPAPEALTEVRRRVEFAERLIECLNA